MGLIELVIVALLLVLQGRVLPVLTTALQLMRATVRPTRPTLVSLDLVPSAQRAVLDLARGELQPLGFRPVLSARMPAMVVGEGQRAHYFDYYHHATSGTLAAVSQGQHPEISGPVSVQFFNCRSDGTALLTLNRLMHTCPSFPAKVDVEDAEADSIGVQWKFHRRRLEQEDKLDNVLARILERFAEIHAAIVPAWLAAGLLTSTPQTARYRFTPTAALNLALRMIQGNRNIRSPFRLSNESARGRHALAEALIFEEMLRTRRSGKLAGTFKLGLMLGTALVATISFGLSHSWSLAPALVAVLAAHEMGHYLAMSLLGYKDLSVFFIPFIGAATAGEKHNATPLQQVVVSLAGPVVGLALGLGALAGSSEMAGGVTRDFLVAFGWLSLAVNFFNLLPVSPLDGGRVVDVLLLSRTPRLRTVFLTVGAAVFVLLGAMGGDWWLVGLAALLGMGIPIQWQAARLLIGLRRKMLAQGLPVLPESRAIRWAFRDLATPGHQKLNFADKSLMVRLVLPAVRSTPPGPFATLGGITTYLAAFIAPMLVALYLLLNGQMMSSGPSPFPPAMAVDHGRAAPARDTQESDFLARLAQARTSEARWRLAMETYAREQYSAPEATLNRYLSVALTEASNFAPDDPRRLDTALAYGEQAAEADAVVIVRDQLDLLGDTGRTNAVYRARLQSLLVARDSALSPEDAVKLMDSAVSTLAGKPDGRPWLSAARNQLAWLLVLTGRQDEVRALLQANVDDAQRDASHHAGVDKAQTIQALVWHLSQIGRNREAEHLASTHLAQLPPHASPASRKILTVTLAWSRIKAGHLREASETIDAWNARTARTTAPGSGVWLDWFGWMLPPRADPEILLDQIHLARLNQQTNAEANAIRQLRRLEKTRGKAFTTDEWKTRYRDGARSNHPQWDGERLRTQIAVLQSLQG